MIKNYKPEAVLSSACEYRRTAQTDREEKFWSQVSGFGDDCWTWLGDTPLTQQGYGRFYLNGKQLLTHRVAWILAVGPIPTGQQVLHRCDMRRCVNPSHLYLGNHRDNMRDVRTRTRHKQRLGLRVVPDVGEFV